MTPWPLDGDVREAWDNAPKWEAADRVADVLLGRLELAVDRDGLDPTIPARARLGARGWTFRTNVDGRRLLQVTTDDGQDVCLGTWHHGETATNVRHAATRLGWRARRFPPRLEGLMDDLLAAAQTAILLGARLLPPIWSMVELWSVDPRPNGSGRQLLAVGRLEQVWRDGQGDLLAQIVPVDALDGSAWYVGDTSVLYPTELPHGSPPLDQWPRIDP
jgi:hypothetical protein